MLYDFSMIVYGSFLAFQALFPSFGKVIAFHGIIRSQKSCVCVFTENLLFAFSGLIQRLSDEGSKEPMPLRHCYAGCQKRPGGKPGGSKEGEGLLEP